MTQNGGELDWHTRTTGTDDDDGGAEEEGE